MHRHNFKLCRMFSWIWSRIGWWSQRLIPAQPCSRLLFLAGLSALRSPVPSPSWFVSALLQIQPPAPAAVMRTKQSLSTYKGSQSFSDELKMYICAISDSTSTFSSVVCVFEFPFIKIIWLLSDHFFVDVFHISHISHFLYFSPLLLGPHGLSIDTHNLLLQLLLLCLFLLQGLNARKVTTDSSAGISFMWWDLSRRHGFSVLVCRLCLSCGTPLCSYLEVFQIHSLLVLSYLLSFLLFHFFLQLLLLQTLLDLVRNLLFSPGI